MISHFITELVKESQTSRRECRHSELPGLQVCISVAALRCSSSSLFVNCYHPGNHPSLGPGHIDPTTAAQYAMVAGAGNGYDVYKGKCSLQTQSASLTVSHRSLNPHPGINGVSMLSSKKYL